MRSARWRRSPIGSSPCFPHGPERRDASNDAGITGTRDDANSRGDGDDTRDAMSGGGRGGVRGALARLRGRDVELKSQGELEAMRAAGVLVAKTLAAVTAMARPGVSTG